MSNLRSREMAAARAWDWGPLNPCFRRGIRLSDIDGVLEINGHFVFIEAKPLRETWRNKKGKKTGQRWMLERLSEKPDVAVLILYGEPGVPEALEVLYQGQVLTDRQPVAGWPAVQDLMRRWALQMES